MKKLLLTTLASAACFAGIPVQAMSNDVCIQQQGSTFAEVQDRLGQGKLTLAMSGSAYTAPSKMYQFGHYSSGLCTVTFRNGVASFASYMKF